ncbi:MAG: tetratricopeptide repeat protein [Candidatus Omnitrophota bacterium]
MRRIFYTISILLFLSLPCFAGVNAKREVRKGNLLYNKGKFDESLGRYEKAFTGAPDSEVVNFDLGTALYKLKDYERALEHFKRSLITEDPSLEQKASYNLGNAEYKFGIGKEDSDLPQAAALLQDALRHYEKALELDFEDEAAKYNYEFVEKELKRLQEKLKQQSQQEKKQQEEKDSEEKQEEGEQKQEEGEQQKQEEGQQQQAGQERSQQDKEEQAQEEKAKEEEAQKGLQEEEEKDTGDEESSASQAKEMAEKEALMLLESYSQDEEPKGLYKQKMDMPLAGEVVKDW